MQFKFKCLPTYYSEKKATQNSQENISAKYWAIAHKFQSKQMTIISDQIEGFNSRISL